jgi:hypothetical protein
MYSRDSSSVFDGNWQEKIRRCLLRGEAVRREVLPDWPAFSGVGPLIRAALAAAPWHDGFTPQQEECAELMSETPVDAGNRGPHLYRNYLLASGWMIRHAGTTGNPRGRPKTGIQRWKLRTALAADLPGFELSDFQSAVIAGRHRTPRQREAKEALCVWLAWKRPKPNLDSLSAVLECDARTLRYYRKEGTKLIAELKEFIEESNERQLAAILAALGINVVAEAEALLEEQERTD